jgi:hypothetical protein
MTPDEDARVKALQLFRAYLGMLALVQAGYSGWGRVADALEDAAREARAHVNQEPPR